MTIGSQIDNLLASLPPGPQGPPGLQGPAGPQGPSGNVPMFVVSGGTEADINAAIAQAAAVGGGDVVLENQPYAITAGAVVPSSNIRLRGQARTEFVSTGTNVNLLSAFGAMSAFTSLSTNVPLFGNQVTVGNPEYFTVGGCLLIRRTLPYTYLALVAEVTAINGAVVSFSPSIPFDVPASDPSNVLIYSITPLNGLMVEGIRFTGSGNSALLQQRGLQYKRTRDAIFRDLIFEGFSGAAGIYAAWAIGARHENIIAKRCGSPGESDIFIIANTFSSVQGLHSRNASGFGPQFAQCSMITVSDVSCYRATHRGIKLSGVLYSNFSNLIGNESTSTGIGITGGTSYCSFSNIMACNNHGVVGNEVGIWFSSQSNRNNAISNVVAVNNAGSDIALYPTDDNNVIRCARYGTIYNGGTNNTVSAT
jgi:hypothetical protein